MYTGSLGAVSNRETWSFSMTLRHDDTGALVDLTGAALRLAVSDQQSSQPTLTGSTSDSKIVIGTPATAGTFTVTFTPTDMAGLVGDNHYNVGLVLTLPGGTAHQIMKTTLAVIDGVVEP
jgi:hypothetical protein